MTEPAGEGYALARLAGVLDIQTYPAVRDYLLKCATAGPDALIADVTGLRLPCHRSMLVFPHVWMRIVNWPGIPLVLLTRRDTDRRLLSANLISRFVPTYRNLETALDSLDRSPPHRRSTVRLLWFPENSGRARRHVRAVCANWQQPGTVVEDAVIVATELVENALRHTCSDIELRLELRRNRLTVAVYDDDPSPAVLTEQNPRTSGFGLLLTARLAKAWGCTPTMNGGKVVWAVLLTGEHPGWAHA
ncbi:ATP-binding protein [Amycolatopsis anabasis]|uniref:ATP-binding protein n=1 Tax=Amycolatopsis anabasis TaxID=1840409 RepID=UPI00131BEDC2|nr:ATP-binding protein [Amycolatopsis anabasis]